jgi:ABC-type antimicrobial peptide transport system permease subunit
VFPADAKEATLVKARINASKVWQMVEPVAVVDDLMRFVFRIKTLFDAFAVLLGVTTVALVALVVLLSMRIRRPEIETLHRIGCSRFAVLELLLIEQGGILLTSAVLATLGVLAVVTLGPDLVQWL